MKKSILTLVASTIISGTLIISCSSSTKKVEDLITDTILKNTTITNSKLIKIKLNEKNKIVALNI